jgi:hypothetical protein
MTFPVPTRVKQPRCICPVCGKKVPLSDPGQGSAPWAARHFVNRVQCRGSFIAAKAINEKGGAK